jgi:hypothetical protein
MRIYSSESFWAIAQFWYLCAGLTILAILGNVIQHGFRELEGVMTRPLDWLILAAALAPGPLAHRMAIRLKKE